MKLITIVSVTLLAVMLSGCVTTSTDYDNQPITAVPINTPSALTDQSIELKTLPYKGKLYAAMLAPTGSMRPTLEDNDLILYVKNVELQSIHIGDIILFNNPESPNNQSELICHRVLARTNKALRTKGDNNPQSDPSGITQKHLYGKLVGVIRGIEPHEPIITAASSL